MNAGARQARHEPEHHPNAGLHRPPVDEGVEMDREETAVTHERTLIPKPGNPKLERAHKAHHRCKE